MVTQLTHAPGRPPSAPGPTPRRRRRGRVNPTVAQLLVVTFVVTLLSLKVTNYAAPQAIRFSALSADAAAVTASVKSWLRQATWLHGCDPGVQTDVPGGYVCAGTTGEAGSAAGQPAVFDKIFTTYPIQGGVRTAVYPSIAQTSRTDADAWLKWQVPIPRYEPYQAGQGANWADLDPYPSKYWTFYYYTLRPLLPLVNAYLETGRQEYLDRLWAVQDSFLAASTTSTRMWADEHAAAWRAQVLVYEWWKLREYHVLSADRSARLLTEIVRTASFLADPNHFQPEMNHGTNEAAALLLVSVAFPDLPGAATWRQLALTRLAEGLEQLVDGDGVLIENSPYYHMYELDKYWQIRMFTRALGMHVSENFESKIRSMIRYATFMLEPDGSVPLLGASLEEGFHDSGQYAEMGELDPQFEYVLSRGQRGTVPDTTSIYLPKAGQTILRSGWGTKQTYTSSSYLTFNVGAYRTLHSQLDSLGITLYAGGRTLLPPGGLYSYDPGVLKDYFQGTSSHNAVVVDGRSQARGTASAGPLRTEAGVTYQSGSTPVYDGVTDMRTVAMLDATHFLVVDRLSSASRHTFDQTWHLFPGALYSRNGLTVTGASATDLAARVTITQLDPRSTTVSDVAGQKSPPAGLCSSQYEVAVACRQVAYRQTGTTASFTTLISTGAPAPASRGPGLSASYDPGTGTVSVRRADGSAVTLSLGLRTGHPMSLDTTVAKAPAATGTALPGSAPGAAWRGIPAASVHVVPGSVPGRNAVELTSADGTTFAEDRDVRADLSAADLAVRLKIMGYARASAVGLELTSDAGRSWISIGLHQLYDQRWDGEWMTLSVARDSHQAGAPAHWARHGKVLDWAHVDGLRLRLSYRPRSRGPAPRVLVESIAQVPEQKHGVVSFVFDDGYESILPAAAYLHRFGYPGNVAVIGKTTELPNRGYLNVFQLGALQNDWGWNMANHSQKHLDGVANYAGRNLGAYEQDLLDGAQWLQRAGLNSAPDWFIYPNGATNAELAAVVGRLYTFARTTRSGSESAPFGSPLRVKTFELHSPKDGSDSTVETLTPVAAAKAAIDDAAQYHHTLIITLHRIHSTASDRPGYPLAMFEQIVDAVHAAGLPVTTLSGLDALNGVTGRNSFTVTPAVPPLVTVSVKQTSAPTPQRGGLLGWVERLF